MESITSKKEVEQRKQAEIRKQIALLQAQLVGGIDDEDKELPPVPSTPKRKQPPVNVLAPSTPSPSELSVIIAIRDYFYRHYV